MSPEEIVAKIEKLACEMMPILTEAKIKESYLELPEEPASVPMAYLKEGLRWLMALHANEYQACLQTKALIPSDQWEMYRMLDMQGSREMIDLSKNFRDLRKKIISKDRPSLFRKKKFTNGKRQGSAGAETSGEGCQDVGAATEADQT